MKTPKYRHYRPKNLGFIEFRGKRFYFSGPFGSDASRQQYADFVRTNWAAPAGHPVTATPKPKHAATLVDLTEEFWNALEAKPRKAHPADRNYYRRSITLLIQRHGSLPIADFGPRLFGDFLGWLADASHVRQYRGKSGQIVRTTSHRMTRATVNHIRGCIRRLFKWGVQRELVNQSQVFALSCVPGLRAGQGIDKPGRIPVPWAEVQKTLPHLSETTRAMVLIQWWTGCRSQDVCGLRPVDIDQSSSPWSWNPPSHKNSHRGQKLTIWIGPQAQEVLKPWLEKKKENQFVFTNQKEKRFSSMTYGKKIANACKKAGFAWTPHQIRHSRATILTDRFGPEAARVSLGHESLAAAKIYSKSASELAKKVAIESG